jgi:hypothetical protein
MSTQLLEELRRQGDQHHTADVQRTQIWSATVRDPRVLLLLGLIILGLAAPQLLPPVVGYIIDAADGADSAAQDAREDAATDAAPNEPDGEPGAL